VGFQGRKRGTPQTDINGRDDSISHKPVTKAAHETEIKFLPKTFLVLDNNTKLTITPYMAIAL
jgi:hypothetical protein